MPSYLARYEDTAAIFNYVGIWRAGSPVEDSLGNQYSQSSFTLTNTKSSTFSFSFYGTEVSVFGAKRGNHGRFQVSLDGVASPVATGQADPARFNETLFTAQTTLGLHNVTMINLEDLYLDIDSVSWLAKVGNDDEPITIDRKEDTDSSFVYIPNDAWSASPPPVTSFSQGSGHATSRSGASAQFTFQALEDRNAPIFITGDAVALYGPVGPTGVASYSVTVGCRPPSFHSSWNTNNIAQSQLLYYGANLGGGTHTLTLKLESVSDSAQILAVDYAEIYTAPSIQNSKPPGDDSCSPSQSGSDHNTPVGLIVGVAVAGFIALLAIGLLSYLYYLYRKGQFNFSGRPSPPQPNMVHGNPSHSGPGYQATPFILPSSGSGYSGYHAQTPDTTMGMAVHSQPAVFYRPTDSSSNVNRMASPEAASSSDPSGSGVFASTSPRSVHKGQRTGDGIGSRNREQTEVVPPPTYTMQ